jgi:apolipoprotein N-acyltransferase
MESPDREVGGGRWGTSLVAVAAGLALGLSFIDFRLWPVPWVAVAPLVALAETQGPRRAWRLGWLAGGVGIGCAFAWLVHAFQVFGGFPLPVALLLFVPPVAWMGLQIGVFTGLLAWVGRWPLALAAPCTFTAVELIYPTLFPWRLAHTQYAVVPLLQSGEIAGPYLLGFAMVWMNAAIVRLLRDRESSPMVAASVLVLALVVGGAWRAAAVEEIRAGAPAMRVGVVQGNIGVERKGERAMFRRNLDDYRSLSTAIADTVDLLVWPETVAQRAIPTSLDMPSGDLHPFPHPPRPLVFGGLAVEQGREGRRVHNSAFLVDTSGAIRGRYDKRVLVPFGEYLPLADRYPWLRKWSPATGRFSPGSGPVLLTTPEGARFGPLICYEDVIPGPAREAVALGAQVLVNLTNDAWYGDTAEPYQHQALALWRAVETRRDFIRSTNTGLTATISAAGVVMGELPLFVAATQQVEVRLLDLTTFYAVWGDVFGGAVLAAWVLGAVMYRRSHDVALKTRAP